MVSRAGGRMGRELLSWVSTASSLTFGSIQPQATPDEGDHTPLSLHSLSPLIVHLAFPNQHRSALTRHALKIVRNIWFNVKGRWMWHFRLYVSNGCLSMPQIPLLLIYLSVSLLGTHTHTLSLSLSPSSCHSKTMFGHTSRTSWSRRKKIS